MFYFLKQNFLETELTQNNVLLLETELHN